jgi:hypothetical protein
MNKTKYSYILALLYVHLKVQVWNSNWCLIWNQKKKQRKPFLRLGLMPHPRPIFLSLTPPTGPLSLCLALGQLCRYPDPARSRRTAPPGGPTCRPHPRAIQPTRPRARAAMVTAWWALARGFAISLALVVWPASGSHCPAPLPTNTRPVPQTCGPRCSGPASTLRRCPRADNW